MATAKITGPNQGDINSADETLTLTVEGCVETPLGAWWDNPGGNILYKNKTIILPELLIGNDFPDIDPAIIYIVGPNVSGIEDNIRVVLAVTPMELTNGGSTIEVPLTMTEVSDGTNATPVGNTLVLDMDTEGSPASDEAPVDDLADAWGLNGPQTIALKNRMAGEIAMVEFDTDFDVPTDVVPGCYTGSATVTVSLIK